MNILHIAAHLGGGAGKAISGMAVQGQALFPDAHRILLLQEPEKAAYVHACRENNVEVSVWKGDWEPFLWADAVVVSWWNHPAMAQLLYNLPPIPVPMLLWCHVNGCHYPLLPYSFAAAFDQVLLTSPYSLENPFWTEAERQRVGAVSEIVWGMGQFAPQEITPKADYRDRASFTIGYAGTLNYGKIHPEFAAYCKAVCERVPHAVFVLAGDRDAELERDIRLAGLADRVKLPGFVSDVPALMRGFDVFGYLLNPEHYGTTENALLEAMACGLPVVAARQNVEQFMIPSAAGYLVENADEYGQRMEFLWKNPPERERMGSGARTYVLGQYNSENNTQRFRERCRQAQTAPAQAHSFSFLGDSPWAWFLFFLDKENRELFESAWGLLKESRSAACLQKATQLLRNCAPILRVERKSSLRHFAAVYPDSEELRVLSALLERQEENCE